MYTDACVQGCCSDATKQGYSFAWSEGGCLDNNYHLTYKVAGYMSKVSLYLSVQWYNNYLELSSRCL